MKSSSDISTAGEDAMSTLEDCGVVGEMARRMTAGSDGVDGSVEVRFDGGAGERRIVSVRPGDAEMLGVEWLLGDDERAADVEPVRRAANASALTVPGEVVVVVVVGAGERRTTSARVVRPPGATTEALGASGDRAMTRAICSALRSSGLSSMSSKNRGVGEGWATWVSSWAITSSSRRVGTDAGSRWIVSPVVAATLRTERSARRDAGSVDSITVRPPAIVSAIGR